MRIYLSSFTENAFYAYTEKFPEDKLNILISYGLRKSYYSNFIKQHRSRINSLILDSGAFTLNSAKSEALKKKISLEGYIAYCKRFGHAFDFYFMFDKNFTNDGLMENFECQRKMENEGLTPVPVVHNYTGEDTSYFIQRGYELIALGFSESKDKTQENIGKLSYQIHNAGRKVHVLGISAYDKLAEYPIAYSDSSSWGQNRIYACIPFWNENNPGTDKTDFIYFKDRVKTKDRKHWYDEYKDKDLLKEYLSSTFGYSYFDLLVRGLY